MALVYDELRAVARRQLRRQRPGQTLGTTALVNEAYLRLVDQAGAAWQDRAHFLSVAASDGLDEPSVDFVGSFVTLVGPSVTLPGPSDDLAEPRSELVGALVFRPPARPWKLSSP